MNTTLNSFPENGDFFGQVDSFYVDCFMKLYYLRKLERISTNTSSIGIIFIEIRNENAGMIEVP